MSKAQFSAPNWLKLMWSSFFKCLSSNISPSVHQSNPAIQARANALLGFLWDLVTLFPLQQTDILRWIVLALGVTYGATGLTCWAVGIVTITTETGSFFCIIFKGEKNMPATHMWVFMYWCAHLHEHVCNLAVHVCFDLLCMYIFNVIYVSFITNFPTCSARSKLCKGRYVLNSLAP